MRIAATSTISHQPTFQRKGFSSTLSALKQASTLISPDYTDIIPAMDRRRMSEVIKMGIACAVDCLEQAGVKQPDAIIVGTSLGCSTHSRNFMDKIFEANEGLISPTSFILSTHNTIAGQISLHLKNHGYNITHTQNSLSFEQALIDALLGEKDGFNTILVGAADELEEAMYNLKVRLQLESINQASGASFFLLSGESAGTSSVKLVDVGSYGLISEISPWIKAFLNVNNKTFEAIDLILYSNSDQKTVDELTLIFEPSKLFDYQNLCGTWFTNSAFALSYAVDVLLQRSHPSAGENINTVLVCNNLVPENLGLILIEYKHH